MRVTIMSEYCSADLCKLSILIQVCFSVHDTVLIREVPLHCSSLRLSSLYTCHSFPVFFKNIRIISVLVPEFQSLHHEYPQPSGFALIPVSGPAWRSAPVPPVLRSAACNKPRFRSSPRCLYTDAVPA